MVRAVAFFLFTSLAFGQVHKIPVNDQWFPSDPAKLTAILDQSFATARTRTGDAPPRKGLLGLVAPHAGLAFSGPIAAAAYSRLDNPANVIVLGFSHRVGVRGIVAPLLEAYATPLGRLEVDRALVRQLGFTPVAEGRVCDHSIENQIPFIQRAAPRAKVIPLYVGQMTDDELRAAAAKLAARLKAGDVIVASSDFTHYGAAYGYAPFANDSQLPSRLRSRFASLVEEIGTLSVPAFEGFLSRTGDTTCGAGPIRLLMAALARWNDEVFVTPLDFTTSGDLTRDWSTSVSYGALAFYPRSAYVVSRDGERRLLASARQTLDTYLQTGKKSTTPVPADQRSAELEQRGGVFVTIKKNGVLRGCLGEFFARRPLWAMVPDRTLASATEDARFKPLTAKEAPVTLEISLLTPMKKVSSWKDVQLGQGVILFLKGQSATLLPQIAAEMGWTRTKLLEELSKKAGLPAQAYKDAQARFYVYSAHVFGEAQGAAVAGGQNGAPVR